MSTKATIAYHGSDENLPSWHLYEEVFEPGIVYLTLQGVAAELATRESGGADLTVRLPQETARQLGLLANVPPGQRASLIADTSDNGSEDH